jgi:hypothetical protein
MYIKRAGRGFIVASHQYDFAYWSEKSDVELAYRRNDTSKEKLSSLLKFSSGCEEIVPQKK